MALIVVEMLKKAYRQNGNREIRTALNGISLIVPEGEIVALLGRSGSGKTTLLKIIGGLDQADSGRVLVNGLSPNQARKKRWFGLIPQDPVLFTSRNLLENVQLPGEIVESKAMRSQAKDCLAKVGLAGYERAWPNTLSGGQRSRASIARALVLKPKIMLADEPGADLDEVTRETIAEEISRLSLETGATAIVITHSIEEACFIADRILVLDGPAGRLDEFEVPLPRQREARDRFGPGLIELQRRVRECLRG